MFLGLTKKKQEDKLFTREIPLMISALSTFECLLWPHFGRKDMREIYIREKLNKIAEISLGIWASSLEAGKKWRMFIFLPRLKWLCGFLISYHIFSCLASNEACRAFQIFWKILEVLKISPPYYWKKKNQHLSPNTFPFFPLWNMCFFVHRPINKTENVDIC